MLRTNEEDCCISVGGRINRSENVSGMESLELQEGEVDRCAIKGGGVNNGEIARASCIKDWEGGEGVGGSDKQEGRSLLRLGTRTQSMTARRGAMSAAMRFQWASGRADEGMAR